MEQRSARNWKLIAAGLIASAGLGVMGGCPNEKQGTGDDSNTASSDSSESSRTSILGEWKIDRDASRAALVSGFSNAAASDGLAENLIEEYGDDADAFADFALERFGPVRFSFKDGGAWAVQIEGEEEGETGEWVKKDGYWIMDPDSPRPQRLELHGDKLHMIQQGEDVKYFYEGFKVIFEPA